MAVLGLDPNHDTFRALVNAYSEPHRFYHTADHIDACLKHLDRVEQPEWPAEIELALWFHDSIYEIFSSKNEQKSASWANQFLKSNSCSEDMIKRVHRLIMVTVHSTAADSLDESILQDIDLSILGTKPEVYDQFEIAIRQEFKRVPYFLYRQGRKKILAGFLSQEKIYRVLPLDEKQARVNLNRAVSHL